MLYIIRDLDATAGDIWSDGVNTMDGRSYSLGDWSASETDDGETRYTVYWNTHTRTAYSWTELEHIVARLGRDDVLTVSSDHMDYILAYADAVGEVAEAWTGTGWYRLYWSDDPGSWYADPAWYDDDALLVEVYASALLQATDTHVLGVERVEHE